MAIILIAKKKITYPELVDLGDGRVQCIFTPTRKIEVTISARLTTGGFNESSGRHLGVQINGNTAYSSTELSNKPLNFNPTFDVEKGDQMNIVIFWTYININLDQINSWRQVQYVDK